jgi:hypothetical protein
MAGIGAGAWGCGWSDKVVKTRPGASWGVRFSDKWGARTFPGLSDWRQPYGPPGLRAKSWLELGRRTVSPGSRLAELANFQANCSLKAPLLLANPFVPRLLKVVDTLRCAVLPAR